MDAQGSRMGWYVPRPMESAFDAFAHWIREFPGLGMLLITCLPLGLVVWSEWKDARQERAAEPLLSEEEGPASEAPEIESAAPAPPPSRAPSAP